jgi:hypothetical protein
MERYDTWVFPKFQHKLLACSPIGRYRKIGTTYVKDTCLTAQTAKSLTLEGLEGYPTSTHLNQRQTGNTNHSRINKQYIKHFLIAKQVVLK